MTKVEQISAWTPKVVQGDEILGLWRAPAARCILCLVPCAGSCRWARRRNPSPCAWVMQWQRCLSLSLSLSWLHCLCEHDHNCHANYHLNCQPHKRPQDPCMGRQRNWTKQTADAFIPSLRGRAAWGKRRLLTSVRSRVGYHAGGGISGRLLPRHGSRRRPKRFPTVRPGCARLRSAMCVPGCLAAAHLSGSLLARCMGKLLARPMAAFTWVCLSLSLSLSWLYFS